MNGVPRMSLESDLLDIRTARCLALGIPPPPIDSERRGNVYDWRRPGDSEGCRPDTPISFRWRFHGAGFVTLMAYGWHRREIGYGRTAKDPEEGYSILPPHMRDAAVVAEFSNAA